jgi:hypothetical protein
MARWAVFVRGGRREAERVLRECADQNGGRVVGDPDILEGLSELDIEGAGTVTAIVVRESSDPDGWWHEWSRVHGVKLKRKPPPQP